MPLPASAIGDPGGDQYSFQGLDVVAVGPGVAHADRVTLPLLDRHRHGLAPHRHLDDVLDVAHLDAVAGRLGAVDPDLNIAFAHDLVGNHVGCAPDSTEHAGDLLGHALELVEVFAEDLHADRRTNAGREHLDPVDDRLGEDVTPAGHLDHRVHLRNQLVLRFLPEHQPVCKGLLQRCPHVLKLLGGRVALGQLPVASQPVQLLDRRPGRGSDGPVEQLPVDAAGPLLEPRLVHFNQVIGHSREQIWRAGPQDFAHELARLLQWATESA